MDNLEDHGQTWKTIFYEPTARWRNRLCSIYLHVAAALMCFATDTSACEVPLGLWLGIQFLLLIVEGFTIEMRERMRESIYWNENRRFQKRVVFTIVGFKEIMEVSWQVYGVMLYFNRNADSCYEQVGWFVIVMALFLLLGAFKVILLTIVFGIMVFMWFSS